jgi:hypothetical protein
MLTYDVSNYREYEEVVVDIRHRRVRAIDEDIGGLHKLHIHSSDKKHFQGNGYVYDRVAAWFDKFHTAKVVLVGHVWGQLYRVVGTLEWGGERSDDWEVFWQSYVTDTSVRIKTTLHHAQHLLVEKWHNHKRRSEEKKFYVERDDNPEMVNF